MKRKYKNPIDELGHLKATAANLALAEKKVKDEVAALGAGGHDGELFRATVSEAERETRDEILRAKIDELVRKHLSPQFIAAHTTRTQVTTVKVVARVQAERRAA
jgi:hypothetical protein